MITYEQFLAFVTGSILDECAAYDCPDEVYQCVYSWVRTDYEHSGFDYQTVCADRYDDWFCQVLDHVVEHVDYFKP